MRKVEYELMTPGEILEAKEQASLAFLPVGPLEWHGLHLPVGTDGLHAHHVAVRVARELGGIVLPTFFVGTETIRLPGKGPEQLGTLGLDEQDRVIGMDFPANPVNSLYFEESAFGVAVRELVSGLRTDSFRLIVLVNGHGALNHRRTLERIAREETRLPDVRVVSLAAWVSPPPPRADPGHADRAETASMLAIAEEHVRLDQLPPLQESLRYADHGIVDGAAFDGSPTEGFVVPPDSDPRRATREEGEAQLGREVEAVAAAVRQELEQLGLTPAAPAES